MAMNCTARLCLLPYDGSGSQLRKQVLFFESCLLFTTLLSSFIHLGPSRDEDTFKVRRCHYIVHRTLHEQFLVISHHEGMQIACLEVVYTELILSINVSFLGGLSDTVFLPKQG